jgi:hypothetical protein
MLCAAFEKSARSVVFELDEAAADDFGGNVEELDFARELDERTKSADELDDSDAFSGHLSSDLERFTVKHTRSFPSKTRLKIPPIEDLSILLTNSKPVKDSWFLVNTVLTSTRW